MYIASIQDTHVFLIFFFFYSLIKRSNLKTILAKEKKVFDVQLREKKECGFGVILLGGLKFDFTKNTLMIDNLILIIVMIDKRKDIWLHTQILTNMISFLNLIKVNNVSSFRK